MYVAVHHVCNWCGGGVCACMLLRMVAIHVLRGW